ncbi:MAG TPA: MFS transporter [Candidatus Olsenella excrementigallinarum]|nr:MFS transporter [Candidatus Olsenella excrementigallinarum]
MGKRTRTRRSRLFTPGFAAIMAAQTLSLLGMEILQFVLPLHLLGLTGSGTLYGTVVALGNVPYLALAPVGGVIADRTRKRSVMAACDLALAAGLVAYLVLADTPALVPATVTALMAAFAAQALYQPCAQSAMPLLVAPERLEQAVAVTNQVGMLTGIGGPVVGGIVYGFCGLEPIVVVSAACFAASAAVAIVLVRVPYEPPARTAGALATARGDLGEALGFLRSRPVMWRVIAAATLVNLFGSSFFNVGSSYVVTQTLALPSQLLGALQAALAVGGLVGGAVVALRPGGLGLRSVPGLLGAVALGIAAIALVLAAPLPALGAYAGLVVCYLVSMAFCMALSIVATSYLQREAPETLTGKVMSLAMTLANLAAPLGQLSYGAAFDHVPAWAVAALAAAATGAVAVWLRRGGRAEG